MPFQSVKQLLERAASENRPLWETILEDDSHSQNVTREESLTRMRYFWEAMKASVESYNPKDRSNSGLVGGDGEKVRLASEEGLLFGGAFFNEVVTEALKVSECNACMKRIVAMPTAGSCGVIPAVLVPLVNERGISDESIIQALYVAAGFGQIIATRSSISGAEGGCQAEVGTASAMAATALTHLGGGTGLMCSYACAMALSNLMGLVCDPIAGLVEIPCVQRNVIGAVNALACANMALAGVEHKIPADEVIDAMRAVGDSMSSDLKETARGGLASTPAARVIVRELIRKNQFHSEH
ncbi:L-serine ammonia-lyase, iron-sulfur-dependent, subunit alpha [Oxalobacter paraformigenes]|uniref:L-serine dehydratase n=1 Tax=Oxalobacter paraformigenes TaxID=556268 RepID=C3X2E0_9BURK|nr:L-serine ammonia-lyase, iron-sulfur-dependent, subunit alpha [Oxalobacter paraformigenes]EEO27376.1 L-serine dehydratase, iron-sulfur-dependent, alpha subunit [Oxalobacter paraformigenes]